VTLITNLGLIEVHVRPASTVGASDRLKFVCLLRHGACCLSNNCSMSDQCMLEVRLIEREILVSFFHPLLVFSDCPNIEACAYIKFGLRKAPNVLL
jgi:hypothetical protein